MRPLLHPAIADVTVEGILHALSDPIRVAIFAEIAGATCAMNCSNFLEVREQVIPKSTLSQHSRRAPRSRAHPGGALRGGDAQHLALPGD